MSPFVALVCMCSTVIVLASAQQGRAPPRPPPRPSGTCMFSYECKSSEICKAGFSYGQCVPEARWTHVEGISCTSSAQCPTRGQTCAYQTCWNPAVAPTTTATTTPAATTTAAAPTTGGIPSCTQHMQCKPTGICNIYNNKCVMPGGVNAPPSNACLLDGDCWPMGTCNRAIHQCQTGTPTGGGSCRTSGVCVMGQQCLNDVCVVIG